MAGTHCAFTYRDGSQCGAWACKEGDDPTLCFAHDPGLDEKRTKAARQGGKASALSEKERRLENLATLDLPTEVTTLQEASDALGKLAGLMMNGLIDDKMARACRDLLKEFRQSRTDVMEEQEYWEQLDKALEINERYSQEIDRLRRLLDKHGIEY